jgi:RNA polymerase primary sigma factor
MEEYEPGSIRTYLMQMGDIPLLTRREELATARRIERTRRNLRCEILASDYVLEAALAVLDEVLKGRFRLEQAVEVSITDPSMAGRILRRIEANRQTLEHLLQRNHEQFQELTSRRIPPSVATQLRQPPRCRQADGVADRSACAKASPFGRGP